MATYPQLLTAEQDVAIAADHIAGMRLADLGRKYGVYPSSIRSALRRQGIIPNNYTRRFDDTVFDSLNTESACYWLGFLFADGYTGTSGLVVNLKRDDAVHLERLRTFLCAEQPLVENVTHAKGRAYGRVSLRINDRAFGRKLAALGITKDRPEPLNHLAHIPDGLVHHWFRGLFDGDGCAHRTGALTFLAPEPILITLRTRLCDLDLIAGRVAGGPRITVKPHISRLSFSGVLQCRRIAGWLYHDATVWMERKRSIIDSWTSHSYLTTTFHS